MFTMMNAARLAVGVQGLALSERALPERLQLRARAPADALAVRREIPRQAGRPVIVHPDVRRMLLTAERARRRLRACWCLHARCRPTSSIARQDEAARADGRRAARLPHPDRQGAASPNWRRSAPSTRCRCFGGHGYIAENGMEQFVRDARITTLVRRHHRHPGARPAGPQDHAAAGRRGCKHFLQEIERVLPAAQRGNAALRADSSAAARRRPRNGSDLTMSLASARQANPEEVGAAAVRLPVLLRLCRAGLLWARSVAAAEAGTQSAAFKQAKRDTARSISRASCRAG